MANKYPHAIYYKAGIDDLTPHRFTHLEEDPFLGRLIERIYVEIEHAHFLKRTHVTLIGYNPLKENNLTNYFRWRGFHVEGATISWGSTIQEEEDTCIQ